MDKDLAVWPDDVPAAVAAGDAYREGQLKLEEPLLLDGMPPCTWLADDESLVDPARVSWEDPASFMKLGFMFGSVVTPLERAIEKGQSEVVLGMLRVCDPAEIAAHGGRLLYGLACGLREGPPTSGKRFELGDAKEILSALLDAGVDPNTPLLRNVEGGNYARSLAAVVICAGSRATPVLEVLLGDARLSDRIWPTSPAHPPIGLAEYAARFGEWAVPLLAEWRRPREG